MKLKTIVLTGLLIVTCAVAAAGQEPSPSPTPATSDTPTPPDPNAEIEKEKERLTKLKDLEKARNDLQQERLKGISDSIGEIRKALPNPGDAQASPPTANDQNNIDSIALSFEALKELSGQISKELELGGTGLAYNRYIVHNNEDFTSLTRYRFFRSQTQTVISRYNTLVDLVDAANQTKNSGLLLPGLSRGRGGLSTLLTGLNIPSFVTPVVKSVAELINVLRPTITESSADHTSTVKQSALVAAIATDIQTRDKNVKFYYPALFVPDYELNEKKEDSVLVLMSKMYVIKTALADFQAQYQKLSDAEKKNIPEINKLIPTLGIVRSQAEPLCPESAGIESVGRGQEERGADAAKLLVGDLIRGEKIDEMIKGNEGDRTGILQLTVLKAGGTKRTSSSLLFGNKTRYSGSVIVEVMLFDNDGTLKLSRTFFHHTGFRKM